jgi:hypothetical protein
MEVFMGKFVFDPSIMAEDDPLIKLIKEWEGYCEDKYNIAKSIGPKVIVEIGVRAGYSAWAFLQANPEATYYGLTINTGAGGSGGGGCKPWSYEAEKMLLARGYDIKIQHDFNSQKHDELPVTGDFYHVDADHTARGAYHDIDLCFKSAKAGAYILVDDYNPGLGNGVKSGTDKWVEEHKNLVETKHFPDTANGDLLIKILAKGE